MNKYKRIFLIVLDSFGIGNAPDADNFGDSDANTLKSISKSVKFYIPNLSKLGLSNIDGVELENYASPIAKFGALQELSNGKDTTIGHFEIAGIISEIHFLVKEFLGVWLSKKLFCAPINCRSAKPNTFIIYVFQPCIDKHLLDFILWRQCFQRLCQPCICRKFACNFFIFINVKPFRC